jgi:lysophospholipase L1-like esterase
VLTPFDRLPAKAQPVVSQHVWALGMHSAGLCARFVTDATSLSVRWSLREDLQAMPHMAATGQAGIDLYVRVNGQWRCQATARPYQPRHNQEMLIRDDSPMTPGRREFLLYLPLYSGVESVSVGVPKGAVIQPAPPWPKERAQPICFYGTSIVHGGCASRPGMAYPAILGRWLDRPAINLGFSGNGKAEVELAQLLSEIDAAVYVIDPLPNLMSDQVAERITAFVKTLRQHRPTTPIVLVESITYQQGDRPPMTVARSRDSNRALRESFEQLQSAGIGRLHYIPTTNLLGDDGEGTVDGTHPTDLGFYRMAQGMLPTLQAILDH